ncbi:MAG TPA: hypothetical protein VFH92_06625 [Phenylobacterium sp.]|nr:hypothetical protein [Phenylobacterium sp.]
MPRAGPEGRLVANSVLACALAYNLVFFLQELFLVLAKAATPGLRPVLFHNNHTWTGHHPLVPLLQGSGALATIVAGAVSMLWLDRRPARSEGWRLLTLWMAVMGFAEALPQVVIGTFIPQNDVGMAMGFLGLSTPGKAVACGLALAALAAVGRWAAPHFLALAPYGSRWGAAVARVVVPLLLLLPLAVPFRLPGAPIEVLFPPGVDALAALAAISAWAPTGVAPPTRAVEPTPVWKPFLALFLLLAAFQIGLRPGIPFF